jgi:hypothetical protein
LIAFQPLLCFPASRCANWRRLASEPPHSSSVDDRHAERGAGDEAGNDALGVRRVAGLWVVLLGDLLQQVLLRFAEGGKVTPDCPACTSFAANHDFHVLEPAERQQATVPRRQPASLVRR